MKKILLLLFLLCANLLIIAQPQMKPNTGMIVGKVNDANQQPLSYVTVLLHKQTDSTVINATSTDIEGKFSLVDLNYDNYYLEVKFLGFNNKYISNIIVSESNKFVKIGQINLSNEEVAIEEVVVTSQVSTVKYEIDKKVVNVAKDIQAAGGTAVDALQNIPSVQVDVEGNVTLRGSSNFVVMVNGKPSILDANDALQQIPVSNIDRIEIITNPSAKFDPDGDAGIINIITKNSGDEGFSGKIEIGGDNFLGYNGSILLNYKKKKTNFFVQFDINDKLRPTKYEAYRRTNIDSSIFYMISDGTNSMGRAGYSGKIGFNYEINKNNNLTFNFDIGNRGFHTESSSNQHLYWSDNQPEYYFSNITKSSMTGLDGSIDLDYDHKFNDKGHKIRSYFMISKWLPTRTNINTTDTVNYIWEVIGIGPYQEKVEEQRNRFRIRGQADYELPINDKTKLEAGYVYNFVELDGDYRVYSYNIFNDLWIDDPLRTNDMTFYQHTHAIYTTFSNSNKILDFKLGLRGEYTDRLITENINNSSHPYNKFDLFPSIHLSKKLALSQQIQLSYSRRINRPHGWDLNPFLMYINQYTIRKGNPNLEPEFTDSYELNYMKEFGKSYVSAELYYKETTGKIDRIQEIDGQTIILTAANLNKDYSYGGEIMTNLVIFKMLMLNVSTNFYQYRLTGTLDGQPVDKEMFTWNSKFMIMTSLPFGTVIQLGGFYNAPSLTLQGSTGAMFVTYGGLRQSFFKKRLTLSINAQDIFMTGVHSFISETKYLYSETNMTSIYPSVGFTLTYKINNYKSDKKDKMGGGNEMEFSGEGEY